MTKPTCKNTVLGLFEGTLEQLITVWLYRSPAPPTLVNITLTSLRVDNEPVSSVLCIIALYAPYASGRLRRSTQQKSNQLSFVEVKFCWSAIHTHAHTHSNIYIYI